MVFGIRYQRHTKTPLRLASELRRMLLIGSLLFESEQCFLRYVKPSRRSQRDYGVSGVGVHAV
jgi:hypothetical protein